MLQLSLLGSVSSINNMATMRSIKSTPLYSLLLFFFFLYCHNQLHHVHAQLGRLPPNITGYTCSLNQTTYPCQTYAFYRATAPDFLDLASVGDLFSVSRLMISNPSNISSPTSPLVNNQSLFVPLTCGCNSVNITTAISSANLTYTIQPGDTYYLVSTEKFQNLTTYQSVEVVNPTLVPTNLTIGQNVVFPIFCKCPDATQLQNQVNYLVSYVFQPWDTIESVASLFGSTAQSVISLNGQNIQPSDTIFVPVSRLPILSQPSVAPVTSKKCERRGAVTGLAIGLGLCGGLLILISGLWGYREALLKRRREVEMDKERQKLGAGGTGVSKKVDLNLMADVSDCLDKYRVFGIEELREATDGFDQRCVIQGSVYRGCIDGEMYAIKKMKWNAYEELKILQKVNHGNLVKLEGFSIDPEDGNCYLIYEYVENGSLHSWLHGNKHEKLSWKTRLRIAIDVANGLQYIHEHTRPRVVHKDIKSSNILLDANMRSKIANFGLAKSGCNAITMHIVGTQGYIAPEYLADGVVSTKMDVFSFGVVLLELVSGREAVVDEEGKFLWTSVTGILDGKEETKEKKLKGWMDGVLLQEPCSMESVMNVMTVAVACLHREPSRRPSMVDIVYALCKSDEILFDVSEDGLSPRQVVAR
ncbi:serine/threonine receptor-like kinase NFP [Cornus florida]|uniref:serine/threonine receptor-like kinase NFP n=1 Tax=Cornus florida TaxID=4283 RepID=UPI002897B173|nr:serine/threonine receptor-like kinase NFP [Cornus florida]